MNKHRLSRKSIMTWKNPSTAKSRSNWDAVVIYCPPQIVK